MFWYQHNRKPPRQLVRIVFWSGIRSNGPKMLIFGPKCQFWAKFGRFWAQNPIFWGQGVKILVPSYRDSNETPFSCWKHWSVRLQLAARGKNNKNKFRLNSCSRLLVLGVKIELLGTNRAERRGPQHRIIMLKSITSVNNWYLMRKRLVLKLD